jgi:hypothetical protein
MPMQRDQMQIDVVPQRRTESILLTSEINFLRPGHFLPGEQQDACELFEWIIAALANASHLRQL